MIKACMIDISRFRVPKLDRMLEMIDNISQIGYNTIFYNIDYLFIITNVSIKGVKTGNTILNLMESLKTTAKKKILVFNRIKNDEEESVIVEIKKYIDIGKLDYIGKLPEDKKVFDIEMKGKSIIGLPDDSPVFLSFT